MFGRKMKTRHGLIAIFLPAIFLLPGLTWLANPVLKMCPDISKDTLAVLSTGAKR
jgi:hypothetical protein